MPGPEHEPNCVPERAKRAAGFLFEWAEFAALVAISFVAIFCFCRELWQMIAGGAVNLGDLMLLFLYTEVIVMAQAAIFSKHEVVVAMPIAIAIVALSRSLVVTTNHDPVHQILFAGAVLILVLALVLWQVRKWIVRERRE